LAISGLNILDPATVKVSALEWHKGYETDKKEHVNEGWHTSDGGNILIRQKWEGNNRQYYDLQ
jgi:hypothetical protein